MLRGGAGIDAAHAATWRGGTTRRGRRCEAPCAGRGPDGLTLLVNPFRIIALCFRLREGALADWGRLHRVSICTPAAGSQRPAYASCPARLVIGRLRDGGCSTARAAPSSERPGRATAAAGMPRRGRWCRYCPIAIVGFVLREGLGPGEPVPRRDRTRPARSAALAASRPRTTIGYTGFLAGPQTIGFLAEAHLGLPAALTTVSLLEAAGSHLSPWFRRPRRSAPGPR